MVDRFRKVLLVEPDPGLLEVLVASLSRRLDACTTCVANAAGCLEVELVEPHHLVIAELRLDGQDGLVLAERLISLSTRPVILLADEPGREEILDAMHLGVHDMLPKPFPIADLLGAAERALRAGASGHSRAPRSEPACGSGLPRLGRRPSAAGPQGFGFRVAPSAP